MKERWAFEVAAAHERQTKSLEVVEASRFIALADTNGFDIVAMCCVARDSCEVIKIIWRFTMTRRLLPRCGVARAG